MVNLVLPICTDCPHYFISLPFWPFWISTLCNNMHTEPESPSSPALDHEDCKRSILRNSLNNTQQSET